MKYDSDDREILLEEGGEVAYIRVGNTVVDVMHGYSNSGDKEPAAVITIYPYENGKGTRFIVYDEKIKESNEMEIENEKAKKIFAFLKGYHQRLI